MSLTVALMAGGKSSRMGTDKSFVSLLGKPMIERIRDRVADLGQDETILIANRPAADYAHLNLSVFSDVLPGKGALGGIYSAIYRSSSDHTLIVACDMPFVNSALLRYMIGLCDDSTDVVIPTVDNRLQGFHAIYSKACLDPVRARLDTDRLKVIGFHEDVHMRYLDPAEWQPLDPMGLSFFNVNTPEDLAIAHQLAADD